MLIAYAACLSALKRRPEMLAHAANRAPTRTYGARQTHDVSAEALCAGFPKPSPRRRSAQWHSSGLAERPVMPRTVRFPIP